MPISEKELEDLLRERRIQQLPEDYVNGFLREFHRRQRSELLRRPLWKICVDRVGNWFGVMPSFEMVRPAALAAVVALGLIVGASQLTQSPPQDGTQAALAEVPPRAQALQESGLGDLDQWGRVASLPPAVVHAVTARSSVESPRYVLDVRPVSYEAPFSF